MTDPSEHIEAEKAVRSVIGSQRFDDQIREVRTQPANYPMTDLLEWYDLIVQRVLPLSGVILTDLNEGENEIWIWVLDNSILEEAQEVIEELGVPSEAVLMEVRTPLELESHTLRDRIRPIEGGTQLTGPLGACTLGFNTVRSGVRGAITVSHCSSHTWATDGSIFYQPTVLSTNRIGFETIDPAPFMGGACPPNDECRWSDSTFIRVDAGVSANLGHIARTTGPNNGSIAIDHNNPTLRIVAEGSLPVTNQGLQKIGRSTGWTTGTVVATCVNLGFGPGRTLLCQDLTTISTAPGDSGSPVFELTNSPQQGDVELVGIHVGRADVYQVTSYIGSIYQDLGASSTWDSCDPAFGC